MAKALAMAVMLLSVAAGHVSADDGPDVPETESVAVETPTGGAVATPSGYVEPTPTPELAEAPIGIWDRLANCESNGHWNASTGNGYYGGTQTDMIAWRKYGGLNYAPRPDMASRSEQIAVNERILANQGWAAWPTCSARLGLR